MNSKRTELKANESQVDASGQLHDDRWGVSGLTPGTRTRRLIPRAVHQRRLCQAARWARRTTRAGRFWQKGWDMDAGGEVSTTFSIDQMCTDAYRREDPRPSCLCLGVRTLEPEHCPQLAAAALSTPKLHVSRVSPDRQKATSVSC